MQKNPSALEQLDSREGLLKLLKSFNKSEESLDDSMHYVKF